MNQRTQPTTLAFLGTAMLVVTLHAEPPMAPPAKLPTTPAEIEALIKTADEARNSFLPCFRNSRARYCRGAR
jgi:hypothetical protein